MRRHSSDFILFKAWRDIGWLSASNMKSHRSTFSLFKAWDIPHVSTCLRHEETHGEFQPQTWRGTGQLSACSKHERHSTTFNLFKAWRAIGRVSALKHEEAQVRFHPVQSMKRQRVTFSLLISKHERHIAQVSTCLRDGETQNEFHLWSMRRRRSDFILFKAWRDIG